MKKKTYGFNTLAVHGGQEDREWKGATRSPVYQAASHRHQTAESLTAGFSGKSSDPIYMRLSNPTNSVLEEKLRLLEGAKGAVVTGSGMAAVNNACMALLRSGDSFISGNSLFMSTYVLFTNIFKKYSITVDMVESMDIGAMEAAIKDTTRFIYLETIGNPKLDIPDIARVAELAHGHGLPLIVDSTLTTPYLCRPMELGADIVIHSTTKYISGHGAASGGVVLDRGEFNWESGRFADFKSFVERKGELAYLDKVWREHHINFGTTQAPLHSYLTMLGLDTLGLRMERHMENAQKVAGFLQSQDKVKWVNHPSLENHPFHLQAVDQFNSKGFGALLTFGLADETQCKRFINNLEMIHHLANLGDCKTLIIHPRSTQYVSFEQSVCNALSIGSDMLRLSVGIEDVEDICADLEQALIRL